MFATTVAALSATSGLPFNWFDLVVVVVLGFGLFRGRRNGMSKELLQLLQWLVLLPLCGLGYPMLAGVLAGVITDTFWNRLLAYLALALVVFSVFAMLKRLFAEKLVKSDFFRGSEYYLGMLAGIVRYACVLLFVLALLNAPFYSREDIARQNANDSKNFGAGLYAGNYFPHLFTIQAAVFQESFFGQRIKEHLGRLLINTAGAGAALPGTVVPEPPKKTPIIKIGK